ncbi:MAG: PD-(D/E)XK nuclease family protein [Planctomycetota bacterium]
MRISATQDETYVRCKRQWWFKYCHDLPVVPRGDLDFGTVVHSVLERYQKADETGRDADGNPVELYPEGWDEIDGRQLNPVQTTLIRKLVDKAQESGVLERRPGREVEIEIGREAVPGVDFIGYVDVLLPGEIQDHKTTKAMRWAKSPEGLRQSLQMLDYAKEAIERDPELEAVTLRHNVYCKDPKSPVVRKVEATVTRAEVEANWKRLQAQAIEMLELSSSDLAVDDWEQVEGPSQRDACRAFGGCPFRTVCSGFQRPEHYRDIINGQLDSPNVIQSPRSWDDVWGSLKNTNTKGNATVTDIFKKRLEKRKSEKRGPAPVTGTAVQINGAPKPPTPKPEPPTGTIPPWADADCLACAGSGFNSAGTPCRICDSKATKEGRLASSDFVIDTDPEGNLIWEAKHGGDQGAAPARTPVAQVRAQERIDAGRIAPAIDLDLVARAQVEEKPAKRGRPFRGYMLYVDCMPVGVETTQAERLFLELCAEMATYNGVGSYYDLNAFERREQIQALGDRLVERYTTQHIVVRNPSGSPDLRAFIDVLKAHAPDGGCIEGLS